MNNEFLFPIVTTIAILFAFWLHRSMQKKQKWASFITSFKEAEYPFRGPDTSRESGGWIQDHHGARVHKAWVTANDTGLFVWQLSKRKGYRPFKIEWTEIASVVFQRFQRTNPWGSDRWGYAEISFKDGRFPTTIPWRELFERSMPETIGFKINPILYEHDV